QNQGRAAEDISFLERELPAHHLIPRLGVSCKVNPVDEELFVLDEVELQVHGPVLLVEGLFRKIGPVDVTEIAVEFLDVLQAVLYFLVVYHIPFFQAEHSGQGVVLEDRAPLDFQFAHPVLFARVDRDFPEELLLGLAEHGDEPAGTLEYAGHRLAHLDLNIAVLLVERLEVHLNVGFELGLVELVGSLENAEHSAFLGELQGIPELAVLEYLVTDELDFADPDLGN